MTSCSWSLFSPTSNTIASANIGQIANGTCTVTRFKINLGANKTVSISWLSLCPVVRCNDQTSMCVQLKHSYVLVVRTSSSACAVLRYGCVMILDRVLATHTHTERKREKTYPNKQCAQ